MSTPRKARAGLTASLDFGMYDSLKPVVLTGNLQGSFLASFLLGWGVTTVSLSFARDPAGTFAHD